MSCLPLVQQLNVSGRGSILLEVGDQTSDGGRNIQMTRLCGLQPASPGHSAPPGCMPLGSRLKPQQLLVIYGYGLF